MNDLKADTVLQNVLAQIARKKHLGIPAECVSVTMLKIGFVVVIDLPGHTLIEKYGIVNDVPWFNGEWLAYNPNVNAWGEFGTLDEALAFASGGYNGYADLPYVCLHCGAGYDWAGAIEETPLVCKNCLRTTPDRK